MCLFYWGSLIAHLVKNLPAMQETWFDSWVRKIHCRRDRLPTPVSSGFPVALLVTNLPTLWETWVQSLGREDPVEKGMAAHSSILTWRIPRTKKSGRLQSMGSQRVRHDLATNAFLSLVPGPGTGFLWLFACSHSPSFELGFYEVEFVFTFSFSSKHFLFGSGR